jgi:hypothetical protein
MLTATPFNSRRGHQVHITPPEERDASNWILNFRSAGLRLLYLKQTIRTPFAELRCEPYQTKSGEVHSNLEHNISGAEVAQSVQWLGYGLDDQGGLEVEAQVSLLNEKSWFHSQRDYRLFSSPQRPDWFWVPSSPLLIKFRSFSPESDATTAWTWQFRSVLRKEKQCVGLNHHFFVILHGLGP